MIKYNIQNVNDWLYNSNPIKGMYYNGRRVYRRFVANGQPTPPTPSFDGKWKATYQDSHTESAECDSTSAISRNEITLSNLVEVEIGDCVTSIRQYAFNHCSSLTSIDIPNSVIWINDSAFSWCQSLTSIDIPNSVTSIGDYAFNHCTALTSITIPSSVTRIGLGAFDGTPWWDTYSADTSHHYGNIIYINDVAYKATSTSITTAAFKSGTVSISNTAFYNCRSLTSVTIGNSVTSIGDYAFGWCYGLTSVTVNATTPPTLGYDAFYNTNDCPIYVPSQSVEAYKSATNWSNYASRIKPIS